MSHCVNLEKMPTNLNNANLSMLLECPRIAPLIMAMNSLSKALKEAIEHNNDGVLLIESGCYQEARQSLETALKQTRMVAKAMKCDDIHPGQTTNIRYQWGKSAPNRQAISESFIFGRGLSIVAPTDGLELTNCKSEATTMLYNLGLSFHLEGASNPKDIIAYSQMLARASKCYRVAVSMRQQHKLDNNTSQKVTGEHLFDLALANNVAEIHLYFMNYSEAAKFYNYVSEKLHFFKELLSTEDLTGFCLNVAAFSIPRMAAAA